MACRFSLSILRFLVSTVKTGCLSLRGLSRFSFSSPGRLRIGSKGSRSGPPCKQIRRHFLGSALQNQVVAFICGALEHGAVFYP